MDIVITIKNASDGNTKRFEVIEGENDFTFSHGEQGSYVQALAFAKRIASEIYQVAKRSNSLDSLPRIVIKTDCVVQYM